MRFSLFPTLQCAVVVTVIAAGCASSSPDDELDPFEIADRQAEGDILDEEPQLSADRPGHGQQDTADDEEWFIIPEAETQPARTIDGYPNGWDLDDRRRFASEANLFEGRSRWEGPDDLSFSAMVDSDSSHLYFWLEVTDDRVLESSPTHPTDAVMIHLRDPRLDDLLESLPEPLRDRLDVEIESGFVITPDGRAAPLNRNHSYPTDAIHSAGRLTEDGYVIEAAFSLEALSYLAEIPLDRIAFRIDVLDADDPTATGPRKRMSAFTSEQRPRFAATTTAGVLPATAPQDRPPRRDALGVWYRDDLEWTFRPIEYISGRWHNLGDRQRAGAAFDDIEALPDICTRSESERRLVEAYEYDNGRHRAVLTLCGTSPSGNHCPSEAETQLVWTALRSEGDEWIIDSSYEIFEEPLQQCPLRAISGEPFVEDFSMLPFDSIDTQLWGIGYRRHHDGSRERTEETQVRLVNPQASEFVLLTKRLEKLEASGRERTLYDSQVYLTDLEDNGDLDICAVEEIREQSCERFMADCETRPRGHEVIPRIDLWNSEEDRFEDFLLTRHQNCRGSTTFEDISPGYQILLLGDRLGLLPTMRQEE